MALHIPIAGLVLLSLAAFASRLGTHDLEIIQPAYAAAHDAVASKPGRGIIAAFGTADAVRNLIF